MIELLREALALNRRREQMSARACRRNARRPRRPELLAGRPAEPSYNEAVRLERHREHLLAVLYEEESGTNNQGERDLRSASVARKTGGCNRAASGARTHEVLASIPATCKKQRASIVDYLIALQRTDGDPPSILATPATPA